MGELVLQETFGNNGGIFVCYSLKRKLVTSSRKKPGTKCPAMNRRTPATKNYQGSQKVSWPNTLALSRLRNCSQLLWIREPDTPLTCFRNRSLSSPSLPKCTCFPLLTHCSWNASFKQRPLWVFQRKIGLRFFWEWILKPSMAGNYLGAKKPGKRYSWYLFHFREDRS